MKVTIEKQDWQLLGQIATEYLAEHKVDGLDQIVFLEFYAENLEAFTFPQRRKRKLKSSQYYAIFSILISKQDFRDDAIWDTTLIQLREKFSQSNFVKLMISG